MVRLGKVATWMIGRREMPRAKLSAALSCPRRLNGKTMRQFPR